MGKRKKQQKSKFIRGHKRSKEPIDHGITKDQFYEILDKASQPIEKPKSDSGKVQT